MAFDGSISVARTLEDCLGQIQRSRAFRRAFMDAAGDEPEIGAILMKPLEDAVGLFEELRIPYALVGGIAAMVYGRARFTEDVDFVAAAVHEQVLAAHHDVMRKHHFDPVATWKLYHESGIEIDIWKDEFSDAIARRAREMQFGGRTVRVAEVHDLMAMKLRADRPQDDYDISEIVKKMAVDEGALRGLVTAEQMARYEAIKVRTRK